MSGGGSWELDNGVRIGGSATLFYERDSSFYDDGRNDRFYLYDGGDVETIKTFSIFDRWGNVLFDEQDLLPGDVSAGWNGQVNGERAPAGTYVYVAKVRFLDGVVQEYGGGVTLLR